MIPRGDLLFTMPTNPEPSIISVFALPDLVFFPKTFLPLHIFEPRYLEMVQEVMIADKRIGMAQLREEWEADYYGTPPAYDIGCIGLIRRADRLPNGRLNILLYGKRRFRTLGEVEGKPYRRAVIESPLPNGAPRASPGSH